MTTIMVIMMNVDMMVSLYYDIIAVVASYMSGYSPVKP